ncbi:MFS transporter [Deinococcus aestuarii]|uniref:MFS transporter n=1 Tax=Deinococcus aestuarii TaxID=2774531 RepID=UPI001C0B8D66|nr:MFS transporter [Deinococcus aestuarii]
MSPSSSPLPASGWRTFLALWGSQSVSRVGGAVAYFALIIYLAQTLYPGEAQKAQLALATGAVFILSTSLAVILAPLTGSLADRHDRRRVMLVCDTLSGVVTLAVAALMLTTVLPLWALLLYVAVTQTLDITHEAAFETSYAMLLPDETLTRANGMMQTTRTLSYLIGPALATLLIGLPALLARGGGGGWLASLRDGVPFALAVDGLSFLVAAAVLTRLHIPSPPPAESHGGAAANVRADTRLGWTYLLRRPPLLHLLIVFAVLNLALAAIPSYQVLLARFTLAPDLEARGMSFTAALAIIQTATSAGMFLGGLAISAWGGLRRQRYLGIFVPLGLMGLGLLGVGLSNHLYVTAAALALTVFLMPVATAHSGGIWQAQVPREMQGRVFAVRRFVARFTAPLGMGLISLLSTRLPPAPVIAALGVLVALLAALQLLNPAMRRLDDREYLEGLAGVRAGD